MRTEEHVGTSCRRARSWMEGGGGGRNDAFAVQLLSNS